MENEEEKRKEKEREAKSFKFMDNYDDDFVTNKDGADLEDDFW